MSDGITVCCPRCGRYRALKKEYDELTVYQKLSLKHPEDYTKFQIPVYTCQDKECGAICAIEFMTKGAVSTDSKNGGSNGTKN